MDVDEQEGTSTPGWVRPHTAHALLHRLAQEQREARLPSVVAGLARDGRLVWHDGRGRVEGTVPDAQLQYRIGSLTKILTAVLVLRLRDEGRLDLADPLDRHLPGTALGDRTLRQLLTHTSGAQAEISTPWWERSPGAAWPDLAAELTETAVPHRAGSRYHYSNLGFATLGAMVAELRGKPWYDVLRAEVLDPLGMRRTTYQPEPPHATGWAVHPWADVVTPEPAYDAGAGAPAGQLWSTVTDLVRLAAFLAGDTAEVIDADTMAEMRRPVAFDEATDWNTGYGLGIQTYRAAGRTLIGHGGSMPGFVAGLHVDAAGRSAAVSLTNSTSGFNITGLALDLLGLLDEHEPLLPAEWAPASRLPEGLLDLVGTWYWGPTPFTLRALSDGLLQLHPTHGAGRSSRFRPASEAAPNGRIPSRWVGMDGYYAGEPLDVAYDNEGRPRYFDLATFIFTRTPYDPQAPIPGGVEDPVWRPGQAG